MASPTQTGRGGSTRQQLDELDALLQRMLALPMDELEKGLEPPGVPLSPPPLLPVGGLPARVAPEPSYPATWSQPAALPFPDAPPPADLHAVVPGAGPAVLLPEIAVPVGPPKSPPPAPEVPLATPVAAAPPEPPRRVPLLLWPLDWWTRSFDRAVSGFGPPGRFLAGEAGKGLLGWSGVLMTLGAAGWGVADWFGWIG